jgi:hypothetical protein
MAKKASNNSKEKSTETKVKTESAHPYSGYSLSKAFQRMVDIKQKFRWRGVSYNAASLSKKQLDLLANDSKFRDISK